MFWWSFKCVYSFCQDLGPFSVVGNCAASFILKVYCLLALVLLNLSWRCWLFSGAPCQPFCVYCLAWLFLFLFLFCFFDSIWNLYSKMERLYIMITDVTWSGGCDALIIINNKLKPGKIYSYIHICICTRTPPQPLFMINNVLLCYTFILQA